jgi:hypothetical protein
MISSQRFSSLAPVIVGALGGLVLLALTSRPSVAAKQDPCNNQTQSLCRTVETCSGGFEPNGTCRWDYTIRRYYWSY